MNIEMPGKEERRRAVAAIVDAAVPQRTPLHTVIRRLWQTVGVRNAFCGVGDAVGAALMVSACAAVACCVFVPVNRWGPPPGYSLRFIPVVFIAPVLYFSLFWFTTWKEQMSGTWQVLAACRYNLRHITAVRLVIISLAGMAFISLATLPLAGSPDYPRLLLSSFCAVFLYGSLTLLALLVSQSRAAQLILPALWLAAWGLLITLAPHETEDLLSHAPPVFSLIVSAALGAAYLLELRIYILRAAGPVSAGP